MTDAELLEIATGTLGPDEPSRYIAIADHFLSIENRAAAAAALDRAFGLAPHDADLARHRAAILDELAVTEHGIHWRFIPAGTFAMGSTTGDPDERPVHAVRLAAYWIADTPMSWTRCCAILGYVPPPDGWPTVEVADRTEGFHVRERIKIRVQYAGDTPLDRSTLEVEHDDDPAAATFDPELASPDHYDRKPMVAGGVSEALAIAARLSTADVRIALPSEAQWEKAARGGLVGRRYPWGDDPPTRARCDFDHMGHYALADARALPPNAYGLYATSGGVSEWCADDYDALAYQPEAVRARADRDGHVRPPPANEREREAGPLRVLRGGSWTDCADAVTVSHRSARHSDALVPTIGFRLVRELLGG